MAAPRHKYEELNGWSREMVERAITDDDPDALLRAVIAVSMYEKEWKYAQDVCVRLSNHRHFNVRGNAVLGFGHIARVHGNLDRALVMPIILAALNDQDGYVRGHAEDTKADTEHFLGWNYENA
jgi:hypothetical protein